MEKLKVVFSAIINFCRGLVRPVITVGLVGAFCFILIEVILLLRAAAAAGQVTPEMLMALVDTVLQFLFTITATVIAFWFGERKNKPTENDTTPAS